MTLTSNFKPIPGLTGYECTRDGLFKNEKGTPIFPDRATGGSKIYVTENNVRTLRSIAGLVDKTWGGAYKPVSKSDPKPAKKVKEKAIKKPKVQTPVPKEDKGNTEAEESKKQAKISPLTDEQSEYAKKVVAVKTSESKKIWLLHKQGLNPEQINSILKSKRANYVIWLYTKHKWGGQKRISSAERVKII